MILVAVRGEKPKRRMVYSNLYINLYGKLRLLLAI